MSSKGYLDGEAAYQTITPAMLEREFARVGERTKTATPFIERASADAIRHWAHGIGDRNPLWTDPAYATASVHGDIVAPPTMVCALDRNVMGVAPGFPGVHAWDLGCTMTFDDVVRRDEEFYAEAWLEALRESRSQYAAGEAFDQTHRTQLHRRGSGEVVATVDNRVRRFERRAGEKTQKYGRPDPPWYSDDELAAIADAYEHEAIRGGEDRFADDVTPGQALDPIIRGPLTVMDCIAFVVGWGGSFLFAHGYAWDFLRRHPGAFPRNANNVPDSPERTHWDSAFAQSIGAPAAFDYGPQRASWCGTLVTNWMGDSGFLRRLNVNLRRPNSHGDLVRIEGSVETVDPATGEVTLRFEGRNQRDELSVDGDALVRLRTRELRP